jgi:hypothetical protein
VRISDILGHAGLALWPIVGLVVFGVSFLLILGRAAMTRRVDARRWAALPLEGEDA